MMPMNRSPVCRLKLVAQVFHPEVLEEGHIVEEPAGAHEQDQGQDTIKEFTNY